MSLSSSVCMSSFAAFLSFLSRSEAYTAACCSRKQSSILNELFQHVLMSCFSLCSGRPSSFCFSFKTAVPTMLQWKNVTISLTLPKRRATPAHFLPFFVAQYVRSMWCVVIDLPQLRVQTCCWHCLLPEQIFVSNIALLAFSFLNGLQDFLLCVSWSKHISFHFFVNIMTGHS